MKRKAKPITAWSIFSMIAFYVLIAFASIVDPLKEYTQIDFEPIAMISLGFIFIGIAVLVRRQPDQRLQLKTDPMTASI